MQRRRLWSPQVLWCQSVIIYRLGRSWVTPVVSSCWVLCADKCTHVGFVTSWDSEHWRMMNWEMYCRRTGMCISLVRPNQARVGLAYWGQNNLRSFKIELFSFPLRLWVMLRSPTGHTSHLGGNTFVAMVTKLSSNLNSQTEKCSPVSSLAQLQKRSSERDQCSLGKKIFYNIISATDSPLE